MKWLILLVLISCGKHEQPSGKDYGDNDGDQILNYQEAEGNKNIAFIKPIGLVKGVVTIEGRDRIEIPFTNEKDIFKKGLELFVVSEKNHQSNDYFSEWSSLKLSPKGALDTKIHLYSVTVIFETGSDSADELILQTENDTISLGKWDSVVRFSISAERLQLLMEGNAKLKLKRHYQNSKLFNSGAEETIKEKTYRVFVHNGNESKVLYVSKKLPGVELLKVLKIGQALTLSDEDLFFRSYLFRGTQWFMKELESGDKVILYTDIEKIRKVLLEKYTYQKVEVKRQNGSPHVNLRFQNAPNAKVVFSIDSIQGTERSFVESSEKIRHGMGGGGGREGNASAPYNCTHYNRAIAKEQTYDLNFYDVLGELDLVSKKTKVNFDEGSFRILDEGDKRQMRWYFSLKGPLDDLEMSFLPRPKDTFVVTGEYRNSCRPEELTRGRGKAHNTNVEGKLSFVVESYVEKMK